jgi:ankyrin repeat protein
MKKQERKSPSGLAIGSPKSKTWSIQYLPYKNLMAFHRGKAKSPGAAQESDDKLLEVLSTASEYGLCPNRIWAVARGLEDGIESLPVLFPPKDLELGRIFGRQGEHDKQQKEERDLHRECTFDVCEQSQINFTSISQRHESPTCRLDEHCQTLDRLFPRAVLEQAVKENGPTAWLLNGAATIKEGQKYMAISHVWSDGTGTGAWDGLKVNRCLFHFFRKLAREHGCQGIWWDTICIPGQRKLRTKVLANMHVNYEKAEITLVHDCFLRKLPWVNAEIACIAILMSPWFSRGWTALELAKANGRVKIAFRGEGRPLIKDLDQDILAGSGSTERHRLASYAIAKLREGLNTVDDLLIVLGSRHTSWAKDTAIISALLVGSPIEGNEGQQMIYQKILKKFGELRHEHLFHRLPTISNGLGWSPISIFDMPLEPAKARETLHVNSNGEATGRWKVIPLSEVSRGNIVWQGMHPFIAAGIRSCLEHEAGHCFLIEPRESKSIKAPRGLLVKKKGTAYQFVGSVLFHPPVEVNAENVGVKILSSAEVEDCQSDADASVGSRLEGVANEQEAEPEEGVQCPQHKGRTADKKEDSHTYDKVNEISIQHLAEAARAPDQDIAHQRLRTDNGTYPVAEDIPTLVLAAAANGEHCLIGRLLKEHEVNYDCMDNVCPQEGSKVLAERSVRIFESSFNSKDGQGRTPLMLALKGKHRKVAMQLLEWYETLDKTGWKDENGRTSLSWAAGEGYEDVSEVLLATSRTEVEAKDKNSWTPLCWAASEGHEKVVELLLEIGKADVEAKDRSSGTPLSQAASRGHQDVVKLLLEIGKANVEAKEHDGKTPLWRAASEGHEEVVGLLLEIGKADVKAKDRFNGRTPLSQAAWNGHQDVVKLLLEIGKANVEAKDTYFGRTPLSQAASEGHEEVVGLLLEIGKADVEAKDNEGKTPLWWAAAEGHKQVVRLLLEIGKADVEAKDNYGMTPLRWAASGRHEKGVKLLLEIGKADVEAKDNTHGRTPLCWAAWEGRKEAVKLLLEIGKANVEAKDKYGATPLWLAAACGHEKVVELLLEIGKADVGVKDNIHGRTPLLQAASGRHKKVVKLLQDRQSLR